VTPGNKGINALTYRGTNSLLDRSTPKGDNDIAQAVECCFAGIKSCVQSQYSQRKKNYIYNIYMYIYIYIWR
jgi:hypothetical protein